MSDQFSSARKRGYYYIPTEKLNVLLGVSPGERNAMPKPLAAPSRSEGIGQLDRGGSCVMRLLGIDSFDVAHRTTSKFHGMSAAALDVII